MNKLNGKIMKKLFKVAEAILADGKKVSIRKKPGYRKVGYIMVSAVEGILVVDGKMEENPKSVVLMRQEVVT
jgi:hypothetical protein